MNKVTIMGRLGRDPEQRFTPNGAKVTTLTIATDVYRQGQKETFWVRATVWGDLDEKIISYLKKGSAVVVSGEISQKPSTYTDREGNTQVSQLEVRADSVRFSPFGKPDAQEGSQSSQQNYAPQQQSAPASAPAQEPAYGAAPEPAAQEENEVPF